MAITEQQREERKKFLGSSDMAALFTDDDGKSLDPFKTAADVWALKTFTQEKGEKESKAMSIGHRYESALIEFARQELGMEIITTPEKMRFICKEHPLFACNLDGKTITDQPEIVEAKTTGLTSEWGEPGTDDVPYRVIVQVHQQMLCTGMEKAHIAVLMGRFSLTEEMYVVNRDENIINAIIQRGEQFWNNYVLTKTPPPDSEVGNINVFKKIVRQPGSFADVDENLISKWVEMRGLRIATERAEKLSFAEILLHLGDAEGVTMSDGSMFTYLKQNGADLIDRKLLKANYPEVYDIISTPNAYRVARIKKGK